MKHPLNASLLGILDQRVVPMMRTPTQHRMRPCEKVRSAKSRTRYVRPMGFLSHSTTSHGYPGSQRHAQTAGSSDPRTILVGGRVGNVACEDQVPVT
jgi:hypothetical protein